MPRRPSPLIRTSCLLLLAALLGPAAGLALEPEDLYDLRTVAIADLSPDGRVLLFTEHAYDAELGRSRSTLFRRDLASGEQLTLIGPDQSGRGAVWRPDGQAIAFVRGENEGAHVWLMAPDGSDQRRISQDPGAYRGLRWSPDGRALACISEVEVGEYTGDDEVIVAEHMGYRHLGDGYRRGELAQLFLLEIESGARQRLLAEELDVRDYAWSPAGRQLVFAAKRRSDLGLNLNTDLWLVGRDGCGLRQLTSNPGPDEHPLWLPDGSICCLRSADPLGESAAMRVAMVDPAEGDEGEMTLLGTGFDNRIWRVHAAGDHLFFSGFVAGCIDLFEARTGRQLTPGGHDFWAIRTAGRTVVLQGTDPTTPSALYLLRLDTDGEAGDLETLYDPNADWSQRVRLFEPRPFAVEVAGREIQGWAFLPADPAAGPYPTVLSIHGGPEWMYGGYFLPEFHILPAHGYAVLIANPTGSTGYGLEFQQEIRGDWVGQPATDLLACLDRAVAEGWADPERLAVMGGSYGGHLAAALTTRTDRFKAAACDRMTCDLVSFWGTTDEKWFPEWEFLGRPWQEGAREVYFRNSPCNFADRVTTPTLISHGLKDYRCLIGQAEIWFSALQVQGVPVRFLRFANEGHGIRRKPNVVRYHQELLAWFDRHVLAEER